MNKKFYVTPEMEEQTLKIESCLVSYSGGDPAIKPDWGDGDEGDDVWND